MLLFYQIYNKLFNTHLIYLFTTIHSVSKILVNEKKKNSDVHTIRIIYIWTLVNLFILVEVFSMGAIHIKETLKVTYENLNIKGWTQINISLFILLLAMFWWSVFNSCDVSKFSFITSREIDGNFLFEISTTFLIKSFVRYQILGNSS